MPMRDDAADDTRPFADRDSHLAGPVAARGSYAKGIAKREQIALAAVEVIAELGFRRAGIKEIAEKVGLSPAGVLHYYPSREELLVHALRKRDELNRERAGTSAGGAIPFESLRAGSLELVRRNATTPGLMNLFSQLLVDAADHRHPAHDFFREREEFVQRGMIATLERAQESGEVTNRVPAPVLARMLHALLDGLQLHALLDDTLSMTSVVDGLFRLLAPEGRDDAKAPS